MSLSSRLKATVLFSLLQQASRCCLPPPSGGGAGQLKKKILTPWPSGKCGEAAQSVVATALLKDAEPQEQPKDRRRSHRRRTEERYREAPSWHHGSQAFAASIPNGVRRFAFVVSWCLSFCVFRFSPSQPLKTGTLLPPLVVAETGYPYILWENYLPWHIDFARFLGLNVGGFRADILAAIARPAGLQSKGKPFN